jgi:ferrous-iron efflux pump FieF
MDSDKKKYLIKLSSSLSIFIASVILGMKSIAWLITESSSVLASLVDSSLDITSSIINFIAIRYALLPPDDNHRFGHDKIQDLAVFGQGIFFMASALFVIISSMLKINSHTEIYNFDYGIYLMLASTVLTIGLVFFQSYVVSATNSNIIKADKLHYITDIFSNLVVVLSVYFSQKYRYLDCVLAILIALYLMHGAYQILNEALKNLLDQEFDPEERNKIISKLIEYKNNKRIESAHDIKTRKAGNKYFIQFHVEINGSLTLKETHEIVEDIEQDLLKIFPEGEIIIHQDPAGIEEEFSFGDELNVSK